MRFLGLFVVVVAACSDEGAELTLRAPAGPASAASFQVILAAPELVATIDNQRVAPTGLTNQSVSYFLQRATGGVATKAIATVDGFTLKIEPTATSQSSFIPFVLLYGSNEELIGIGTFHDGGAPAAITVMHGEIDKYTIEIEPVAQVADTDPVAASQAMPVECGRQDQTTFTSGVAWRPQAGGELRLLFPTDSSTDATQRTLDLDCDGHAVQATDATADCDDSRARFYQGAPDVCDGEDTNCDEQRYIPMDCMLAACGTAPGVQLCDDSVAGGDPIGSCAVDASTCPMGCTSINGGHCDSCVLAEMMPVGSTVQTPCAPAISIYSLTKAGFPPEGGPYTVRVAGGTSTWVAEVGSSPASLGISVANVTDTFYLHVDSPAPVLGTDRVLGAVYLDILDANATPQLLDLELDLSSDPSTECQPYQGTSIDGMTCQQ